MKIDSVIREVRILKVLSQGAAPADVQRRTDITFPTVSRYINMLKDSGDVEHVEMRRGGMGKPPEVLRLTEKGHNYYAKLRHKLLDELTVLVGEL